MKAAACLVLALTLPACSVRSKNARNDEDPNRAASIGVATMLPDGTIMLDLHSRTADGSIGDARLVYAKNNREYSSILHHLGGLKPSEVRSVPPWPD